MEDFLASIRRQFIIGDGPMGTMLLGRLGSRHEMVEEFSLHEPEQVVRLHREYADAGAELLGASTFSANRVRMSRTRVVDLLEEVNRLGVQLAREAAAGRAWVLGKLGPTGRLPEPLGDLSAQEATAAYQEQASILATAGADVLAVETMADLAEACVALDAIRSVTRLPVIVSFAFDASIHTMMGVTPEQAAITLLERGADVVGSNCGVGPDEVERSIERMARAAPQALLLAEPNAGVPTLVGQRIEYPVGPGRFAAFAQAVVGTGARIVAACCGATPEHTRAMAERCRALALDTGLTSPAQTAMP